MRFSPYFEGNLTTSGTGHIRFWKMASTFTGGLGLGSAGVTVRSPDVCRHACWGHRRTSRGLHACLCKVPLGCSSTSSSMRRFFVCAHAGLKLQGAIGKFGAVELSDVGAFVEMPDGKVLSGTETGDLLMWDGGLIKVVLNRTNKRPCHDGQVRGESVLGARPASCTSASPAGVCHIEDAASMSEGI